MGKGALSQKITIGPDEFNGVHGRDQIRYSLEVFDKEGKSDVTRWKEVTVHNLEGQETVGTPPVPSHSFRRDQRITSTIPLTDAVPVRVLRVPQTLKEIHSVSERDLDNRLLFGCNAYDEEYTDLQKGTRINGDLADCDLKGVVLHEFLVPPSKQTIKVATADETVVSELLLPYPGLKEGADRIRPVMILPDEESYALHKVSPVRAYENGNNDLRLKSHESTSVATGSVGENESGVLFVGLLDFTAGRSNSSLSFEQIGETDEYDKKYPVRGRGAFFLKGKVKGKYLITAMMDTQNESASDMLKKLDEKDPRYFLRHLDPDRHYPIYGDDSEATLESNTQGRFYLRIEWDNNQIKWGNYNTGITDTELAKFVRSLYGAHVRLESDERTKNGDARRRVELFASDTASMSARNDFLGTGGSLYYLKHQYLMEGAAKVQVELRDVDSNLVLERITLARGVDYEIDEYAGRIILSKPLLQIGQSRFISTGGSLDGDRLYLVVEYEYLAPCGRLDLGEIQGGRASAWIGEKVRIGFTHIDDQVDGGKERHRAADVKIKLGDDEFITVERAESETQGVSSYYSSDGGLSFRDGPSINTLGDGAAATHYEYYRLDKREDGTTRSELRAFLQDFDRGYRSSGYDYGDEMRRWGVQFQRNFDDKNRFILKHDDEEKGLDENTTSRVQFHHVIDDRWLVTVEGEHRTQDTTSALSEGSGTVIAAKILRTVSPRTDVYIRGQEMVRHDDSVAEDDRIGIGVVTQIDRRTTFDGELSTGTLGEGWSAGLQTRVGDDSELYGVYSLNTDAIEGGYTQTSWGTRTRVDGKTRVNVEDRFRDSDREYTSSRVYGIERQIDKRSRFNATFERGSVFDPTGGESRRRAFSFGVTTRGNDSSGALTLENRVDNGTSTREQFLLTSRFDKVLRKDLKALIKANYSDTRDRAASETNTTFSELTLALAMRPKAHDHLHWLAKATALKDIGSTAQADADFAEKAFVFSIEGVAELSRLWSLAGKVSSRDGSIKMFRENGDWIDNRVDFYALRLNYHVNHRWDCYGEYRRLIGKDVGSDQKGWLLGVNRIIHNLKVGIGYNFTDFSDDLTDLDFRDRGWFFRAGVKF